MLPIRIIAILAAVAATPAAAQDVVLETTAGDIVVYVDAEHAPVTGANFLRYVDEKRLDGTVFYRAMRLEWGDQPNGLVQAGTQNDPGRTLPPIPHEPTSLTGLRHLAGSLSMARYEPGTATGDFSILLSAQPGLDADPASADDSLRAGYAVFGRVLQGMDVVRRIFDMPTDPDKGEGFMRGQMLAEPVRIVHARRASPGELSGAQDADDHRQPKQNQERVEADQ